MKHRLSILICTIPSRAASYGRLITELRSQMLIYAPAVGIISNASAELSIGAKRNWLLDKAGSDYVCFIDDDDEIQNDYIDKLIMAMDSGCDCASLKGRYFVNGRLDGIFEHSIKYNKWETAKGEIKYLRYPNHLNMIKASIAKQFKFPEINHGEDENWSTQIHNSGLLKTEYYIPEVIYHYLYKSKKMSYSQNSEETFILEYFKDHPPGRFIDIGAYSVEKFSNVRQLYLNGWKGVLVEPAPENYKSISDHYKDDKEIIVLNCAVGTTGGEIDFYSCEDAVSTSDIDHKNKWEAAGVPYTKIKVNQVNVIDFMNEYCKDIDFLSIDTEGTNIQLFRMIPDFVFEQIKMICIEHDGFYPEISEKLGRFGFNVLHLNAENIILAK